MALDCPSVRKSAEGRLAILIPDDMLCTDVKEKYVDSLEMIFAAALEHVDGVVFANLSRFFACFYIGTGKILLIRLGGEIMSFVSFGNLFAMTLKQYTSFNGAMIVLDIYWKSILVRHGNGKTATEINWCAA